MHSNLTPGIAGPGDRFPIHKALARAALITTPLAAAMAAVLLLMGRSAWCRCGRLSVWSWDIWSSHNSQHLVDPYFFTHVLHGVLFCGLLYWLPQFITSWWKFSIALALECGWELLENSPIIIDRYRTATFALDYYGDSAANSVVDVLACAMGYGFAVTAGRGKSVALVLISELLMTLTIRDCLALNLLMLVYPVEAIKQWQLGG